MTHQPDSASHRSVDHIAPWRTRYAGGLSARDRHSRDASNQEGQTHDDPSLTRPKLSASWLIGCARRCLPLRVALWPTEAWGTVGLAQRYPRRLMDSTCQRDIENGVHTCKRVKVVAEQLVIDALVAIDAPALQNRLSQQVEALDLDYAGAYVPSPVQRPGRRVLTLSILKPLPFWSIAVNQYE